jgi:hypothetical protein
VLEDVSNKQPRIASRRRHGNTGNTSRMARNWWKAEDREDEAARIARSYLKAQRKQAPGGGPVVKKRPLDAVAKAAAAAAAEALKNVKVDVPMPIADATATPPKPSAAVPADAPAPAPAEPAKCADQTSTTTPPADLKPVSRVTCPGFVIIPGYEQLILHGSRMQLSVDERPAGSPDDTAAKKEGAADETKKLEGDEVTPRLQTGASAVTQPLCRVSAAAAAAAATVSHACACIGSPYLR